MWPACAQLVQPCDLPQGKKVQVLLDGSGWIRANPTATLRDMQRDFIDASALDGASGTLGLDLVALLPLHYPLHDALTEAEQAKLEPLVQRMQRLHQEATGEELDALSCRAAESSPLIHWQWLRRATMTLQCPAAMTELQLERGFKTTFNYAELHQQFHARHILGSLYAGELTKLSGYTAEQRALFLGLVTDRLLAQQLLLLKDHCKRVPAQSSNDTGTITMSMVRSPDTWTKDICYSEGLAHQLLPKVVPALTTPKTDVTILVSPRPNILALVVADVVAKREPKMQEGQCFLLLNHVSYDIGATVNRLVASKPSADPIAWLQSWVVLVNLANGAAPNPSLPTDALGIMYVAAVHGKTSKDVERLFLTQFPRTLNNLMQNFYDHNPRLFSVQEANFPTFMQLMQHVVTTQRCLLTLRSPICWTLLCK